MSKIISK